MGVEAVVAGRKDTRVGYGNGWFNGVLKAQTKKPGGKTRETVDSGVLRMFKKKRMEIWAN